MGVNVNAVTQEAVQIYSRDRGKVYLEIVPTRLGIRVQTSELGKRTLEKYWTVWLRELLLSPGQTRTIGVGLEKNCLNVRWSGSKESLIETVRSIAAQIKPLPTLPMRRVVAGGGMLCAQWAFDNRVIRQTFAEYDASPFGQALAAVKLPRGYELGVAPAWAASLQVNQSARLPAWEVALLVEMQVALALHGSHPV